MRRQQRSSRARSARYRFLGQGSGRLRRRSRYLAAPESLERRHLLSSITIDDVTVGEADSNAVFTVSFSGMPMEDVTINWETSNGSAETTGDYSGSCGVQTVTIYAPDQTSTISIPISSDSDKEADENFFITLSNASLGTITDDTGIGTIIDDDATGMTNTTDVFWHAGDPAHLGFLQQSYVLPDGSQTR